MGLDGLLAVGARARPLAGAQAAVALVGHADAPLPVAAGGRSGPLSCGSKAQVSRVKARLAPWASSRSAADFQFKLSPEMWQNLVFFAQTGGFRLVCYSAVCSAKFSEEDEERRLPPGPCYHFRRKAVAFGCFSETLRFGSSHLASVLCLPRPPSPPAPAAPPRPNASTASVRSFWKHRQAVKEHRAGAAWIL